MPGGVFNRGFVRAVARYIGMDEDGLVAEYALAMSEHTGTPVWTNQHPQKLAGHWPANPQANWPMRIGILLAVLVLSSRRRGRGGAGIWTTGRLHLRRLHPRPPFLEPRRAKAQVPRQRPSRANLVPLRPPLQTVRLLRRQRRPAPPLPRHLVAGRLLSPRPLSRGCSLRSKRVRRPP